MEQILFKLSVSFALVYTFYHLLLRPLTFFNWNRWYLLTCSLLGLLVPFIDMSGLIKGSGIEKTTGIEFIPTVPELYRTHGEIEGYYTINDTSFLITVLFGAGVVILILRLVLQLYSYRRIRLSSVLLSYGPVNIYEVNKNIVPFSFGNSIFVNPKLHDNTELDDIIQHEFVHVRQKHTVDMIWAEIICIVNWYNPFAWMIRKAIRENLEFLADSQVLSNGVDKKQYQYLLLKVAGGKVYRITNQFNFSSLRKRIRMMNKVKTALLHLIRFIFILPLLLLLLFAFRSSVAVEPDSFQSDRLTAVRHGMPLETKAVLMPRYAHTHRIDSADPVTGTKTVGKSIVGNPGDTLPRQKSDLTWGKKMPKIELVTLTLDTATQGAYKSSSASSVSVRASRLHFSLRDSVNKIPPGDGMLFIVDGVRQQRLVETDLADRAVVESISIVSPREGRQLYGKDGANGVVFVTTRKRNQE